MKQRRSFLRSSTTAALGVALAACTRPLQQRRGQDGGSTSPTVDRATSNVLLVFFSRAGENYFRGGRKELAIGNTEVAARMIREALGCEAFEIHPVDPYPHSYDATVQRNLDEQNRSARPQIVNLPPSLDAYETILLGSPVWNVRAPRILLTFAEHYDFSGKTVHPFTTYAMSGLGEVVDEYAAACRGARLGEALAIRGEEADSSRPNIDAWLRRIGLVKA